MNGRCILLVLDSVGIGALPDAESYGDLGSDTLGHICEARNLEIPHLESLGLGCIRPLAGIGCGDEPLASYGKMRELSQGKDSTSGHWEIAGLILREPFVTFPNGFPSTLINQLQRYSGRRFIGNKPASGTAIIHELGRNHCRFGHPIIYTSSDPVLQIAAHEDVVPIEELYELCQKAFELAVPLGISRVIARPFIGEYPSYVRTHRRRDFSVRPPAPTVLEYIQEAGIPVVAIGKVGQLFSGVGMSETIPTKDNAAGIDATASKIRELSEGLIFTTLIDFDMLYGHRRDVRGYATAIEMFDERIPEVLSLLESRDLLIITADHGNDPTFRGTDHTREFVPVLAYGPNLRGGRDLGTRDTFADIAATVADFFSITWPGAGVSFLDEISVSTYVRKAH